MSLRMVPRALNPKPFVEPKLPNPEPGDPESDD